MGSHIPGIRGLKEASFLLPGAPHSPNCTNPGKDQEFEHVVVKMPHFCQGKCGENQGLQRSSSTARRAPEPHPHAALEAWGAPARCFCTFNNPAVFPEVPAVPLLLQDVTNLGSRDRREQQRCHKAASGAGGGRCMPFSAGRACPEPGEHPCRDTERGRDVSPAHRNVPGVKKSASCPPSSSLATSQPQIISRRQGEHEPRARMQWPRENPENLPPNKQLGKAFGKTKL